MNRVQFINLHNVVEYMSNSSADKNKEEQNYGNNKEHILAELQGLIENYISKRNDETEERDGREEKMQLMVNTFIESLRKLQKGKLDSFLYCGGDPYSFF